ncbi:MAG: DUF2961 domain-containing protein [Phycisphaerae bacterium]|nr:DUF2961 domain-containing protein [Phycisphaerae bacterium]
MLRSFANGFLGMALMALVLAAGPFRAAAQAEIRPSDALFRFGSCPGPQWLVQAGYFSSYDRTGGNNDGFEGTYSALYRLANGEHVIVDLDGPGCLYTLWFTGIHEGYELPIGQIRFYLDGEDTPRAAVEARELFTGDHPMFPAPLVANDYIATGGNVAYVPIPFQRRLIITTEKLAGFYNAFHHRFPPGTRVQTWTGKEDLTAAIAAWDAVGAPPARSSGMKWYRGAVGVAGNERRDKPKVAELLNLQTSGMIRAIRLNPGQPQAGFNLNHLWLKIWWDGQEKPSVDVPLGPFFGSALGETAVRSLAIGMSSSGPYYCYLPMPFRKAARIVLENHQFSSINGIHYEIAVSDLPARGEDCPPGLFTAVYHREWPTTAGKDHLILHFDEGRGLYLGHCLMVQPYAADNKQWWEGDLRVWPDRRRHPILNGTGHEDEFLGGWSNRWLEGPYSLPLHGLPAVDLFRERADGQWNGAITAYRFFAGGIPFRSGIKVSTEHGLNNVVVTNYASVAYCYLDDQPGMVPTDMLELGNGSSEQSHTYRAEGGESVAGAKATFTGDESDPASLTLQVDGRKGATEESFTMKIDPANKGVLLRRLYLQSEGRHRARVSVDDSPVGFMGTPDDCKVDRWREEDFILPPPLTAGKDKLAIRIEVETGSWNVFGYQAWSIRG